MMNNVNKNRKKQLERKRKIKKKQKIKLYIRRAVFLIITILIIYLLVLFVLKGISSVFGNRDVNTVEITEDISDEIKNHNIEEKTDKIKNDNSKEITDETINGNKENVTEDISHDKNSDKLTRHQLIKSGTIYDGIFLDEISVGEMNYDEAVEAYNNYIKDSFNRKISFTDMLGSYNTTFNIIGMDVNVEDAVTNALTYGRSGNILERYKEIETLKSKNVTIIPDKIIDSEKIKNLLEEEATELVKLPVNASMIRSDGQFIVYESEKGLGIDYDKTIDELKKVLKEKWDDKEIKLAAVTTEIEPTYTEDDFYGVDTLLGRCVTEYNVRNSERIANLAVGAHKIADHVLLPGQQFSVYDAVAPFTEENGYHNAGQYINAELVDGLGGGICQVATTLYDAVLEAELQVDERYPHSMTVSYVDKGMDAAIAEGYQDFKFTNNTEYPIYIDAYAGGGSISVAIYGHETRSPGRRIEFESQVIETYEPGEEKTIYDDTLPSGTTNVTDAHTGYYVEVWKHIYQDGELLDSVKINGSEYQPVPKTTRIGTMSQ